MVSKESLVYPRRPPIFYVDDDMRGDLIRDKLMTVFPSWSATRISRWLDINPRTMQRWLSVGKGTVPEEELPADLQHKISAQAQVIEDMEFVKSLDTFIEKWTVGPKETTVDPEVMAAWLADRYAKLINREID